LPHKAFTLQIGQNHGLQSFCLMTLFCRRPSMQKFAMPFPTLEATIVLSDFVRSFSAEKKNKLRIKSEISLGPESEESKGLSEKRAGSMACSVEAFF
jgi:hypothetical protein